MNVINCLNDKLTNFIKGNIHDNYESFYIKVIVSKTIAELKKSNWFLICEALLKI